MEKKWLLVLLLSAGLDLHAQVKPADSLDHATDSSFIPGMDPDFDYDVFFSEMSDFLDSLLRPSSYLQLSMRASTGYFRYKVPNRPLVNNRSRYILSPSVSYYNRSGFGIAADADYIAEKGSGFYQYVLTPSFDYLRNLDFSAGVSFSKYIHRDRLPFYLSPLNNEVAGYFVYRKKWLWPSVAMSYAWGKSSDYQEQVDYVRLLRLRRRLSNAIAATAQVNDLSITTAVSHNFYFFDIFSGKDFFRFTPQVYFNAGTQQFGFNNRNSGSLLSQYRRTGSVSSSRSFDLNSLKSFEALSTGILLKASYTSGRFFIQPELSVDYYLPADTDNISILGAVNIGFNF
ncbi:MAG: hypothetical protein EOO09_10900 [Chitinophagaceae bacterium]|nr:MAG: hypothetical protein EOO09_10900 [Chitinophagaceae bacterium]